MCPQRGIVKISMEQSVDLQSSTALTYWEEVPCDRRGGEAREHVVCAAEMGEVGAGHGLTSTLTPHQNLAALGLGCRRVAGVARSHLHHPSDKNWS